MISAVLQPFLFLAGHEAEYLPASRTEGGGMQMLKQFSVCPDYLSSPSSFIKGHKFILRAHIPPMPFNPLWPGSSLILRDCWLSKKSHPSHQC